ncbi:MAG: hypothetical protein KH897_19170 [Bacteroides sp.]|uniref:hypothetical protein n=1 Tax=Bacteroides TaxID=816 RepID=UPI0025BE86A7|nr:hypothetical protein [Bacteroides sp.]MBS6240430.1 hypothetical protein [Bacteroides sp.]
MLTVASSYLLRRFSVSPPYPLRRISIPIDTDLTRFGHIQKEKKRNYSLSVEIFHTTLHTFHTIPHHATRTHSIYRNYQSSTYLNTIPSGTAFATTYV